MRTDHLGDFLRLYDHYLDGMIPLDDVPDRIYQLDWSAREDEGPYDRLEVEMDQAQLQILIQGLEDRAMQIAELRSSLGLRFERIIDRIDDLRNVDRQLTLSAPPTTAVIVGADEVRRYLSVSDGVPAPYQVRGSAESDGRARRT